MIRERVAMETWDMTATEWHGMADGAAGERSNLASILIHFSLIRLDALTFLSSH